MARDRFEGKIDKNETTTREFWDLSFEILL